MTVIRIARTFGRVDVDQWLTEISHNQLAEQIAYDLAKHNLELEAMKRQ